MLFRLFCIAFCLSGIAACKRDAIRVYTAPKDPLPASTAHEDADTPTRDRPRLTWTLPKGWEQTDPGKVSVANFVAKSESGEASINITPMPNLAGRESLVVNMWREQLGQTPLREEEVAAALTPADIAGETGHLFELVDDKRHIVTAMLHRPDGSWFFKLAGDTATVAKKKPDFVAFLKSIQFPAATPAPEAGAPATTAGFNWQVPANWEKAAPGQMQVAKFIVNGGGATKSEVTVSIFPNDTGGTLANVNRWRSQIGLGPIDDGALSTVVKPLDPNTPDAVLADLANENGRRLLGAIVPRGGQWFFYKMLGDGDVVAQQREAFVAFAISPP